MPTIGQRAETISLERRPCIVILKDGERVHCERIENVSKPVVTSHSGDSKLPATGSPNGQPRPIFIDDIQDIVGTEEMA